MLEFVLYRSRGSDSLDAAQLLDILRKSVKNNTRDGISGFLHVRQDAFCQYIEGESEMLQRRVRAIKSDRRHRDFEILAEGRLYQRIFPDWGMGGLASPDLQLMPHMDARKDNADGLDLEVTPVLAAFEENWRSMYELRFDGHTTSAGLEAHSKLMEYLRARLTPYVSPTERDRRHELRSARLVP